MLGPTNEGEARSSGKSHAHTNAHTHTETGAGRTCAECGVPSGRIQAAVGPHAPEHHQLL